MTDKNTELDQEQVFDPLDMNNYKVEKLPKMEKSGFEKWMARLGGPIAILLFILIYWVIDIPLFDNLDFSSLGEKAQKRLGVIGEENFIRACYAMLAMILLVLGWFIGVKVIFPLKPEEKKPQIEGGMERLRAELDAMGKMTVDEYKSIAIFVGVLLMWMTGEWHGIDETTVAFIGAIIALMPGIGVVKWNDVDIPWHLMLFSGLLFQSKTMRALIFIPIAIGVEQQFGFPPLSLSFPVALLIEHVYVLPFNSKPAALLYTTNHYSWSDTFRFGITMMVIAWIMILIWGETVLHWLGYTPGLF